MNTELHQYKINQALQMHLPKHAVPYCYELWKENLFIFKIRKPRVSKAGDYSYHPAKKTHTITVNKNLNRYNFLITYIHEVAHLIAFKKYGRNIAPHGIEWKTTFSELMKPLLTPDIFPEDVLKVAHKHFKNPKASSAGDHHLVKVLSKYDPLSKSNSILLDELPVGESFIFRNKSYKKIEKRRTRILCEAINDKKKYLISKAAVVENHSQTST